MIAGYFDRLRVRASSIDMPVAGLSGGNQQKVVLARWLAANVRLLILDEPTRGVDVGAKAEIHALIGDFVTSGGAVLLISSELPELLALSNRVLVVREGRIVAEVPHGEATEESLLRGMAGLETARTTGTTGTTGTTVTTPKTQEPSTRTNADKSAG